ncbi:hypothetical protein HanRHA438_Chr14g0642411 [Helianthus annuus]|nr:hypothetical protein HanRHA438_Chr14g0642411 [Helianthus annuus]
MSSHFHTFTTFKHFKNTPQFSPFLAEYGQQHSAFLSDFQLTSPPISSLFIFLKHLDNL